MNCKTKEIKVFSHNEPPDPGFMRVTLVGSGPPQGVPVLGHFQERGCVCAEVLDHPLSRDARLSASLLITFQPLLPSQMSGAWIEDRYQSDPDEKRSSFRTPPTSPTSEKQKTSHHSFTSPVYNTLHGARVHHILIDCGKMFRDAYFKVLLNENLRCLNGLFLTSSSASSLGGLDDLRDLQSMSCELGVGEWFVHHFIPTYVLPEILQKLQCKVPYILRNSLVMGSCPSSPSEYFAGWSKMKKSREAENAPRQWNNIGIRRSTALQIYTIPLASSPSVSTGMKAYPPTHEGKKNSDHPSGYSADEKDNASNIPVKIYVDAFGPDVPVYALPLGGVEKNTHTPLNSSAQLPTCFGLAFGRGIRMKPTAQGMVFTPLLFSKTSPPPLLRDAPCTTSTEEAVTTEGKTALDTGGSCVVYLPYVGCGLSEGSLAFLNSLQRIDLLILECLCGPPKSESTGVSTVERNLSSNTSGVHSLLFDAEESNRLAMENVLMMVRGWRPLHVVTTGMSCSISGGDNREKVEDSVESSFSSERGENICTWLRKKLEDRLPAENESGQSVERYSPIVSMGYDGLSVMLPL